MRVNVPGWTPRPWRCLLIFYIIESLAIQFNFEQDFWKPAGKTVFFIDFILPDLSITTDGLLMSNIYDFGQLEIYYSF